MRTENLQERYDAALEAGRNRDYLRAVELLQGIVVETDRMPEALLYLGRSYHALEDYPRAVQAFGYYLRQQPDSSQGHFFIGRTYFALGLLSRAGRHLRESVRLDAGFAPALGLLGLTLLKSGHPETSVQCFEQALALAPGDEKLFTGYLNALLTQGIRLFHRRSYQDARANLQFILKHRPDSLVAHLYLASIYRELGDHARSLEHFEQASRLQPDDPVLYLQKAATHLNGGDHSAAYAEMGKAMKLLGQQPRIIQDTQGLLRLMTLVLFQNQRHREALECARQVLRQDYHDGEMHAVMAECFGTLGELRKAKNHYQRALEADRRRIEYSYGLADVLWRRGEYRELEALLSRILKLNPGDSYASYYRALSLPFLDASCEQTIPLLQEQIRGFGPDPHLMHALGQEYLRAELPELAEGWFRRTLQRVEDHRGALLALVRVYRELSRAADLQKAFARYLEHYPEDRSTRREFAELLFGRKRYAAARRQLETLLPTEPNSHGLRRMLATCYQRTRRYPEAILLYRELLLETPRAEDLLRALVHCLEETGSRPTAVLLLEKAAKMLKNSRWLPLELARLHVAEEQLEKAATLLRQVVSERPKEWRAYQSLGELYRRMGSDDYARRFLERAEELKKQEELGARH
ncbi:MAG: tetratricopeptide repeat protein [Spirochaetales bacterium]|nr:tetratricopeptide repeat protein [Spirochaetales bacterium]